jgi:hypothetical protein
MKSVIFVAIFAVVMFSIQKGVNTLKDNFGAFTQNYHNTVVAKSSL